MMAAKFFYLVSGTLFRSKADENNPIKIFEVFKDDNPIIAREKAFRFYQNYIDVFLESKGRTYVSYEESVIALQDFVNSYQRKFATIGGHVLDEMEIHVDFDKGLNIFMILSDSEPLTLPSGELYFDDSYHIHYINNEFMDLKREVFSNLRHEYSLYEKYGYDIKTNKREFNVAGLLKNPKMLSVLETPINFNHLSDSK